MYFLKMRFSLDALRKMMEKKNLHLAIPRRNATQLQCIDSAIAVQYFNALHNF